MTDEMYCGIGKMIIEFSRLDATVSFVYDVLHPAGRITAAARRPEPVKNRLECCISMLDSRAKSTNLLGDTAVVDLRSALTDAKKTAEDRNLFAHGDPYTIEYGPDDEPDFGILHRRRTGTRDELVTIEFIDDLRTRISNTHYAIEVHARTAWKRLKDAETQQSR